MTANHADASGPEQRIHPYAWFVVAHPLWVLAGVVLVTTILLGILSSRGLGVNNNVEVFVDKSSDTFQALETLRTEFGSDSVYIVTVEGDVYTESFLTQLKSIQSVIEDIDLPDHIRMPPASPESKDEWAGLTGGSVVDQAVSLVSAIEVRAAHEGIEVGKLVDIWPTQHTMADFRARVESNPQYVGRLVDGAGTLAAVLVRTEAMETKVSQAFIAELEKRLAPYQRPQGSNAFIIRTSGANTVNAELTRLSMIDTELTLRLSLSLAVVFLFVIFRHPLGALGPMVVLVLALLWTLATLSILGWEANLLTSILPALLTAVAVGDSIHVQSVYRDLRAMRVPNDEAIRRALTETLKPMLYTSLTTGLGLLALAVSDLDSIVQLGVTGAVGIFYAFLLSITVVPVFLTWNKTSLLGRREDVTRDWVSYFVQACQFASGGTNKVRRAVTLGIAAMLVALSLTHISKINVAHDPVAWFPEENPVRKSIEILDQRIIGGSEFSVLINAKDGSHLRNLELMQSIEAFTEYVSQYRDPKSGDSVVGVSSSIVELIKETNQALHGADSSWYRLPDTEAELRDILFVLESTSPDQLKRLMSSDSSNLLVSVQIKWLEAMSYGPLAGHIQAGISRHFDNRWSVHPTGTTFLVLSTLGSVISSLLSSFGVAFMGVTVLLIIFLKSLRLGLVAMIPNLVPITLIAGFMVLVEIPLTLGNIMNASLALGICADDTIHFLHYFQTRYREHGVVERAIQESMHHTGRAIVITTSVLGISTLVFLCANLSSYQSFTYLMSLTVCLAVVADLVLAAAVLRIVYPDQEPVTSHTETLRMPINGKLA